MRTSSLALLIALFGASCATASGSPYPTATCPARPSGWELVSSTYAVQPMVFGKPSARVETIRDRKTGTVITATVFLGSRAAPEDVLPRFIKHYRTPECEIRHEDVRYGFGRFDVDCLGKNTVHVIVKRHPHGRGFVLFEGTSSEEIDVPALMVCRP